MATKLEQLLNRSKNIEADSALPDVRSSGNMIDMSYNGANYHIAIRDKVLVFSDDMNLIYTVNMLELATSQNDFLKEVNKIVVANTNQKVTLYVNKADGVERLTFSSLFDATFIFRKLVRLTSRKSEGIQSIVIEDDAKIVRQYVNENNKFILGESEKRGVEVEDRDGRNPDKTEYIAVLARVEDLVEEMIGKNISTEGVQLSQDKIDKCIELLQSVSVKEDEE